MREQGGWTRSQGLHECALSRAEMFSLFERYPFIIQRWKNIDRCCNGKQPSTIHHRPLISRLLLLDLARPPTRCGVASRRFFLAAIAQLSHLTSRQVTVANHASRFISFNLVTHSMRRPWPPRLDNQSRTPSRKEDADNRWIASEVRHEAKTWARVVVHSPPFP